MSEGVVILVGSDFIGRGDQRLGSALARDFFRALTRREGELPAAIVFINAGVRLLVEGSPILAQLEDLDSRDVQIVGCRVSVQHFDLEDKLEVGDTLPMNELADLLLAHQVLSL